MIDRMDRMFRMDAVPDSRPVYRSKGIAFSFLS